MKLDQSSPRSPDTFDKWSDQHRAQVWDMIERLANAQAEINAKLSLDSGAGYLVPIRTKGPGLESSTRRQVRLGGGIAPRSANAPKRPETQPAEAAC
jgi:hypothetical protein